MSTLLINGTIIFFNPITIVSEDLKIADGKIVGRAKRLLPQSGDTMVNLAGKLVLPGMICAHTHLYSALARGMPGPSSEPKNFLEILQKVWWVLDKALDEESIYYSALIGGIEAVLAGTTCLIDHHASPNAISGSLSIIKKAFSEIGIRGILSYEVTDRDGMERRDKGLEENRRFLREETNQQFKGMVGAHASFTLCGESLERCGRLAKEYNAGIHIHAAEDLIDIEDSATKHGKGLVDRLARSGILLPKSILAHGTHLNKDDLLKIKEAGSWLVHNPKSNMNNHVGYAPVSDFGDKRALGTDGIGADMFEEIKFAFFKARDAGSSLSGDDCLSLLTGGHKISSLYFEQTLGKLEEGAPADLAVLDYEPPTPLSSENFIWHLLFGIKATHVESVMVGGEWIVQNRKHCFLDIASITAKAKETARKLWRKMQEDTIYKDRK